MVSFDDADDGDGAGVETVICTAPGPFGHADESGIPAAPTSAGVLCFENDGCSSVYSRKA